jgi:branched-chain amino acid transport system ATP-binding protein
MASGEAMTETLLKIQGVTKSFGGLTAVSNVSLALDEGEILGLIGPNGAGKTTLFNLISGIYRPERGQIIFNGAKITGTQPYKVCQRGLARTFQIVKPFASLSVVDNVMVGAFLKARAVQTVKGQARELVDFVGLARQADQPAHNLTTAGRKRLELARALATQPRLLLLDEVMAGLTPSESAAMVDLIRQVRGRGITVFVIEHVMQAIMTLSDRIAVLHHGQLIAIGEPRNIAGDQKVIEAYLGEEFRLVDD